MSEDQDGYEQRPVDDHGGIRFHPPIVHPTRTLPFDQLPWDDFKRLCLMLLPRGGEEAIAKTFHAIQDVGRWWP